MILSVLILFTVFGLLASCTTEINEQPITDQDKNNVELHILDNGQVNFEGEILSIPDFKNTLRTIKNPENTIVQFRIS